MSVSVSVSVGVICKCGCDCTCECECKCEYECDGDGDGDDDDYGKGDKKNCKQAAITPECKYNTITCAHVISNTVAYIRDADGHAVVRRRSDVERKLPV